MNIELYRNETEDGLKREVWKFYFDWGRGLRLTAVLHQARQTKRHGWKVETKWDSADTRSYYSTLDRPRTIPLDLVKKALDQVTKVVQDSHVFIGYFNHENQVR